MCEAPSRARRRLEAAVAPAGVEVETLDSGAVDDRRAIHRHVHDAAPGAQQPRATDHRHQRHAAFADVLDGGEVAALRIAVVAVDVAAEHETALVRLADVEVPCAEGDDARDQRLQAFGDERLQHMALDRELEACERRDARGVASAGEADLARGDRAPRGLDAGDGAARDAEPRHLAVLDDVDAEPIGGARVAPGDGVMPHRAAAGLQQTAADREARVVEIEEGQHATHVLRVEQLGIHALQSHGVAAPHVGVALCVVVVEVEHAALADHRVVVDVLLEPFPELERPFIERRIAGQQVVRADDGGVAADIAAADPTLLEHRDVPQAVHLGEVVRGGETVPAAADDHGIVGRARRGIAPRRLPTAVATQRFGEQSEGGVAHDGPDGQGSPPAIASRRRAM